MLAAELPFYEVETSLSSALANGEPSVGLAIMAIGITAYACCLWLRQRVD